ncbi:MAG: IPT/TIG domain-containing protein [Burkholderiales bacterium]
MLLIVACGPALAATVLYVYDELGRLVAEIDPAAETTLYSYDAAGNLLSVSRGDSSAFRLVAFNPTRGKTGDTVLIYGSGFIADPAQNSVSFNGTPATVAAASANTLTVTVPSGVTTGPIAASNANGSAVSAQPFTVIVPPVITGVAPASVSRGALTRITISGAHLANARAITFSQPGLTARIVLTLADDALTADLSVAGTVAVGAYAFSVTSDGGTTDSGSVTVAVTTQLLGEVLSLAPAASVHLRAAVPGAPPGNAMSAARTAVSVHLPAVIPGAPAGNAMSTTGTAVSVHLPVVIAGAPAGNAMSATGTAVSVHLPAVIAGAPPGNAMNVTQPISVSMP